MLRYREKILEQEGEMMWKKKKKRKRAKEDLRGLKTMTVADIKDFKQRTILSGRTGKDREYNC